MTHRCAGGEAFGCIDDGVGIHAVMAIEVVDGAGLLDAERFDAMPALAEENLLRSPLFALPAAAFS